MLLYHTLYLNFLLNKKTLNGRTYKREELLEKLYKLPESPIYMCKRFNNPKNIVSITRDILGMVTKFNVDGAGRMMLFVEAPTRDKWLELKQYKYATVFGEGLVDEKQVVHNFELSYFFVVPDEHVSSDFLEMRGVIDETI